MGQLSSYEVEEICETVYYQVINTMSRYDYVDSSYEFASKAVCDFKEWSYPKFNFRIVESHKGIVNKWEEKLRAEAKSWFEENVVRRREEENRQHEIRKQQREREEREEREEEEREAQLRAARRRQEEEENRETEEALRRKEREEAEEKQRLAEEEARREAELAIKSKAQNDVNKQKLEQIQAQWKEKQNSNSKTVPQYSETNNKMSNNQTCPQCGNQVSSTAKFCTNCGTKLSATCPSCGTSLKPTSKFCTNCGTPVAKNTKSDTNLTEYKHLEKESEIIDEVSADELDSEAAGLFTLGLEKMVFDPQNGIHDIESAAEMNHIEALFYLGSCYYNGEYVEEDKEKAEKYLKKASELGHAASQYCYALILNENGRTEEYYKWLRKSVDAGYSDAQYLMGTKILEELEDAPFEDSPEFKELMKWMSLAAEQNHGGAQHFLGLFYAEKDFSFFSIPKAKEFLQKAVENGDEDAIESLKELNEKFPD